MSLHYLTLSLCEDDWHHFCPFISFPPGVGQEYGGRRCETNDCGHMYSGEIRPAAIGHGQRIDEHQRHNRCVSGESGIHSLSWLQLHRALCGFVDRKKTEKKWFDLLSKLFVQKTKINQASQDSPALGLGFGILSTAQFFVGDNSDFDVLYLMPRHDTLYGSRKPVSYGKKKIIECYVPPSRVIGKRKNKTHPHDTGSPYILESFALFNHSNLENRCSVSVCLCILNVAIGKWNGHEQVTKYALWPICSSSMRVFLT